MDPQPVVGIEVSKAARALAVDPSEEAWTSATTPAALDALVARLTALAPALSVLEATGGDEMPVAGACSAAGLRWRSSIRARCARLRRRSRR